MVSCVFSEVSDLVMNLSKHMKSKSASYFKNNIYLKELKVLHAEYATRTVSGIKPSEYFRIHALSSVLLLLLNYLN